MSLIACLPPMQQRAGAGVVIIFSEFNPDHNVKGKGFDWRPRLQIRDWCRAASDIHMYTSYNFI